ncbi:uncharacterized protein LOC135844583 [Planococcus citri]|uniref:uncharacterized protein LOC135844583 n=1 Tax=Planococcus citri TaxID=170843 RepID=UPI0031F8B54C
MTVKVIGAYLMLSFLALSVFAYGKQKVTEDQFKAFKGVDPCENSQRMRDVCDKLVKPKYGSKATLLKGYPECGNAYVSLQLNCGKGTTTVPTTLLTCSYKENEYYTYGKGQTPNHVMRYDVDPQSIAYPWADESYNCN